MAGHGHRWQDMGEANVSANEEVAMNRLLTVRQAAEFFQVSESTIRRWTKEGVLPYVKVDRGRGRNGTIRYRGEDLLRVVQGMVVDAVVKIPNSRER